MCTLSVCVAMLMNIIIFVVPTGVRAQDPMKVYVDDDFVDDPLNHRWNTTQKGVNDVAVGGTVYVYSGIYVENILISKSLDLVGNSSTNTTIAPPQHDPYIAIIVNGSSVVSISGFSIVENTTRETFIGVYVNESSEVTLRENYFENMGWGVVAENGGILHVENNTFHRYEFDYYAEYQIAITIWDLYTGVPGNGYLSTIANNTIFFEDYGHGIRGQRTAISLIENNTIIQNNTNFTCNGEGMEHSAGIVLYQYGAPGWTRSRNNKISGFCFGISTVEANLESRNELIESTVEGIGLNKEHSEVPSGSFLNMTDSTINNSASLGIMVSVESTLILKHSNITNSTGGVFVFEGGESVLIENSTFYSNGVGIKTYGKYSGPGAFYTTVFNNIFKDNGEAVHSEHRDIIDGNYFETNEEGIRLQSGSYAQVRNNVIVNTTVRPGIWIWKSTSNTLTNNSISNGVTGILASDGSDGNKIEDCMIWNNDFGIHIDESDQINIENHDVSASYESGILVSDSEFVNIRYGNMTNNYIGIDVQSSNNTVVFNNSLLGNVLWAINATGYVNASDNYFGTNDTFRIDKMVSDNVDFSNPLPFRESGANITNGSVTIANDTEFSKGQVINGNLTIDPGVNVTFTNATGHNFIQVNGQFIVVNGSYLEATHGYFTLLATNGSTSDILNARFEKQMGVGIQTTNMTVVNCSFTNGTAGIVVNQGVSNTIQNSDFIANSRYGVYLFGSSSNIIQDNLMVLSRNGIQAYNSTLDSLSWNNISANEFGIKVSHSSDASIHNNTITNNHVGAEIQSSWYTMMNNNSIVGNVCLAISGSWSIGTNVHYNYFGTNDSAQIEKLCEGVDCSLWNDNQNPDFRYIDDTEWNTPQSLTKGVIVNGNLTIDNTQVSFSSPNLHNFIQVNGLLEINASQLLGDYGMFTVLYLNKSSGTIMNSTLDVFHGVGVQSESGFLATNTTFTNGTYRVLFWKSKLSEINNSTFERNEEWSVGLFHSDQNKIETTGIVNSSIGIHVYSSCWNTLRSNEITDNPIGIWLNSRPLSVGRPEVYPKGNEILFNEFYNNDVGILASYSDGNTVGSNVFSSNGSGTGAELSGMYAKNMTLSSNLFKDNEHGVLIFGSTRNEVDDNTFTGNTYSIDVESSRHVGAPYPPTGTNNVITANDISVDWGYSYGVRVRDSELNFLGENTISSSSGWVGIWIEESDNNTVANNSVSSNIAAKSTHGIHLENAGGNNLTNNTITNFTYNFGIEGEEYYDFVEDIDSQNTVDGRKIYYFVGAFDIAVNPEAGYYGFVGSYNVSLSNVDTIEHSLQAYLLAYSHHILLENVSASNTYYGVQSYMSHRNVIANSTFYRNHQTIYLDNSNHTTISNISSKENYGGEPRPGVYLYESHHNLVTNNTTVSSNRPGIRLEYSYYNTISYCNLTENVVGGIAILYSGSNNISRCSMTANENGVYILASPSNNVTNSTINGNNIGVLIRGVFSKYNLVSDNYIMNSSSNGILVEKNAADNILSYNDISESSSDGLHIDMGSSNIVTYNNITYNQGYGVKATNSGMMNQIHHNNFVCNKANCSDGYQGYDDFIPATPTDGWHDTMTGTGNYWTNDSWSENGGIDDFPPTYWVDPPPDPQGLTKDQHPQAAPIPNAGPRL